MFRPTTLTRESVVRFAAFAVLAIICLTLLASSGTPSNTVALEDRVAIESRSFLPGQMNCSLGIHISNIHPVNDFMLPFEFRTLTGGAYLASNPDVVLPVNGRVHSSYGGAGGLECPETSQLQHYYAQPNGPPCFATTTNTYRAAAASMDFVSPDAIRFYKACNSGGILNDSVPLPPGTDTEGTGNASFALTFEVNSSIGTFFIDTVCVYPAQRIMFVHNDNGNVLGYAPAFTPAVVTIECGPCRCHADPNCDGITSIIDVGLTVNRALREAPLPCDPYSVGGNDQIDGPTDVDCSGATDIVDIVKVVEVTFRGGSPATEYCAPCP